MKQCTVCKESKKQEDFYKLKKSNDGLAYRCKQCDNKAIKDYRHKNQTVYKQTVRNTNLKQRYGVDMDWYNKTFEKQGKCCAICKTTENAVTGDRNEWSFAVDHCHHTNNVRGILCNTCNRAMGLFGDSTELLTAAVNYLNQFKVIQSNSK